jgi:dTDP-4-dehydrorhamnose 3,5-epimerase
LAISIKHLPIDGLILIQPVVYHDERGLFLETYSEKDFSSAGIGERFVQDNESASKRGVVRGLHFQTAHPQGKLVRAVSGRIFDVAVDLRAASPRFGSWEAVILSSELMNQLYIPPGFAHGSLALSDDAVLAYKCTDFYYPEDQGGIRWDDPALGIAWPDLGAVPILSARDRCLPAFDPARRYFE